MRAHPVRFDDAAIGGFSNGVEQELREREELGLGDAGLGPAEARVWVVGDVGHGRIAGVEHPVYGGMNRVTQRAGDGHRDGDDVRIVVSWIS